MGLGTGVWHDVVVTGIVASLAVLRQLRGGTVRRSLHSLSIERAVQQASPCVGRVDVVLQCTGDLLSLCRCVCRQNVDHLAVSSLRCLCTGQLHVILVDGRLVVSCPPAVSAVIQVLLVGERANEST